MLVSEYDLSEDKISVLPIVGVDTSIFQPVEMEPLSGSIAVATVGRLSEAKGYDDLIDCARRLGPEYQFHVAGDGSLRDWLETEAPENVCFHGTISNGNVPDFLNGADIYFQPSKYEGLCMTVIEAMSCGLPVVASAVGGITESVVPGETGYLCERGDVGCFCSRIEALSRDSERRAEFGRGGRERVLSKYSMTELTNGFREVVRQLNHRVSGSER
jgi:glycosyltransferase involved in cell wall biosynthesis